MSASVKQAREALGARLREIRRASGLTGRVLADQYGWHFTKVSKLEHGTQPPTDNDLRAYCTACGAEDELADLMAAARSVESMYIEWQRSMRAGIKRSQETSLHLYETTRLFRVYEGHVIPGLIQTAEYTSAVFRFWADFLDLPNDLDQAVAARMERQRVLYNGDRRFLFVLEEQALRTRVGDESIMAGQLDRLLAVMSLPRVSVGIIRAGGVRHTLTQGSFWIFDDDRVQVEGLSAKLEITQPRELALYTSAFDLFQRSAAYGVAARQTVHAALAALSSNEGVNGL